MNVLKTMVDVHRYAQILLVPTPVTAEMDGFFLGMGRHALVCPPMLVNYTKSCKTV